MKSVEGLSTDLGWEARPAMGGTEVGPGQLEAPQLLASLSLDREGTHRGSKAAACLSPLSFLLPTLPPPSYTTAACSLNAQRVNTLF